MRALRAILAAIGVAASIAALALGRPQVFAPLAVCGVVAFVVAAGCLAADVLPLRRRHAVCSALSLVDAIALPLAGQVPGVPLLVPALLLVVLQVAPALSEPRTRRLRGAGA
jgi:hypothetical protein